MQSLKLEFEESAAEFYIASLARGILEGIKSGALTAETGIWSLGRPVFRNTLTTLPISAELKEVLESFDELDALTELGIDLQPRLQRMIDTLDRCQRSINVDTSLIIRAISAP
ncbi:hypothetical protein [Pseudomonas sp. zfem005]|uniref:hypothetical protein n=1 Tax=Pseudomonas sp. zfem005 TaxID=3078200 RepID=UPI00292851FD|nr:hypothetical protein [Pseudomonas sp. zfem005]MDU9411008.1 hypothetical protein [Pseudomonas sp. zfem005]